MKQNENKKERYERKVACLLYRIKHKHLYPSLSLCFNITLVEVIIAKWNKWRESSKMNLHFIKI